MVLTRGVYSQRPGEFKGEFLSPLRASPASEHGTKASFGEDASGGFAVVALNLDATFFHRSADAASALDGFRQLFLFRLVDTQEATDDGDSFAAAMSSLPGDVNATTILSWSRRGFCGRCHVRWACG